MSQTTVTSAAHTVLKDFGNIAPFTDLGFQANGQRNTLPEYVAGTSTHNMTMYRSSRTGLVFSAGTGTWSWGLAPSFTQPTLNPPEQVAQPRDVRDNNVIQATFNLLADMGAFPHGLAPISSPLVFPSGITDTTSPNSWAATAEYVTSPVAGWKITGKASDDGVGTKVANVEVSGDGGEKWHRATLTTLDLGGVTRNWEIILDLPSTQVPFILARATDYSFNMEQLRVLRDQTSASNTLHVYGGSVATSGSWDNNIEIEKSRNPTTQILETRIKNHGVALSVSNVTLSPPMNNIYSYNYGTLTPAQVATVPNVVVQLAIGANNITLKDLEKAGLSSSAIAGAGVSSTFSGNVHVYGGIGKDTFSADRIKIAGELDFIGGTGADTVSVTNSVVVGETFIDGRRNGNGSSGTVPVGASITFEENTYPASGSTLTIRTGVGNDHVTAKNNGSSGGGRLVNTFSGNDTITRGQVNLAVDKLMALMGGDGDDTYAYARNTLPGDTITDSGGSDWLDFSASENALSNFAWPTQFENLRGTAQSDSVTISGGGSFEAVARRFDPGAGTNMLSVMGGNVFLDTVPNSVSDPLATLATTVSGGAHLKTNRLWQTSLTITGNSRVTLAPDNDPYNSASKLKSLTIHSGSTLDITDHALIIDYTGTSPLATIRSYIILGRAGGSWTGTGITSSTAATFNQTSPNARAVGYAQNNLLPLGSYSTFRDVAVDGTSILIAYTRTGDANLNGIVDDDDVTVVGALYSGTNNTRHWFQGDFDFDGLTHDNDVTLLGVFYNPGADPV